MADWLMEIFEAKVTEAQKEYDLIVASLGVYSNIPDNDPIWTALGIARGKLRMAVDIRDSVADVIAKKGK